MEQAMLNISALNFGLRGPEAARRWRERTGKTSRGYDLWTPADTETLQRLYPDYDAAMKALPNRSHRALEKHASEMGFTRRRHTWTAAEITRLRKLAATGASRKEIVAAFAPLSKWQVFSKLRHHRIKRPPSPYKTTGYPVIDAIRARCRELRLTMRDLDAFARTGKYFTLQQWRANDTANLERAAKAIRALGGTFTVTWEPAS